MINKKYRTFSILIAMVTITFSCQNWLDVNENPNAPANVDYKELLAPGISSVAYVMGGRYQVLGALWSQHWTQSPGASQYQGLDDYNLNSSTFDGEFSELYSGALANFEEIKLKAIADKQWKYAFIANIMQVYTYQVLADLYNQIPFSEALKGEHGITEPIWESGEDIYDSLLARIDTALSYPVFNDELEDPANQDLLFEGNMDYWIQFANTIKLKIYLRQSEVNNNKARTGVEELYTNETEFLEVNAAMTQFLNQSGNRNPLYETEIRSLGNNPNLILSRTLHSYMEEYGDFNRLDQMFYTPENGGGHKSLPQGDYNPADEPSGITSASYSKPAFFANSPVYIMSIMESLFLQSEAIVRYGVDDYDQAREKYQQAIFYSFARLLYNGSNLRDITVLAESFYFGEYSFPSEGSGLEQFIEAIIVQKWVALAGIQSLETFFEHNRCGYPGISTIEADNENYEPGRFTISVNNITSGRFPKRLLFPESEYATNRNTPDKKEVWEKIWWNGN